MQLSDQCRRLCSQAGVSVAGHLLESHRQPHLAAWPVCLVVAIYGWSACLCCRWLLHVDVCCRSVPPNKAWPLALVLCPTRELAQQLAAHAMQLVAGTHLGVKCVTGGTPIAEQVQRSHA